MCLLVCIYHGLCFLCVPVGVYLPWIVSFCVPVGVYFQSMNCGLFVYLLVCIYHELCCYFWSAYWCVFTMNCGLFVCLVVCI